jgi:hypothetical protein
MKSRNRLIGWTLVYAVLILVLVVGAQACHRSADSKAATQVSTLAMTPAQKSLWRLAADQDRAPGLSKLEKTNVVTARRASPVSNQAIQTPSVGPDFPSGVTSALKITASPGLDSADLRLPAIVSDVDASGERVTLDLGGNRTLTFAARAGGRPIGLARGDRVSVDYRANNERFDRRQTLAVRAPNGSGIARIRETGQKPLTINIPLFSLEVTQSGPSSTSVDVRVGDTHKTLMPGEVAQVNGMTVGIIASRGVTGRGAKTLEGSAYAIEVIAWPTALSGVRGR